jgi:hypothetical protein
MSRNRNRIVTELLDSTDIIIPTLLGKNYHIENEHSVYQVVGTRWRSKEIVLKEASSDKMLVLFGNDFFKTATIVDD